MSSTTVRRSIREKKIELMDFWLRIHFFRIITTNESRYDENQSNNCNNYMKSRIYYVSVVCLFINLLKKNMKLISETWFLISIIFDVNTILSNAFRAAILKFERNLYITGYWFDVRWVNQYSALCTLHSTPLSSQW